MLTYGFRLRSWMKNSWSKGMKMRIRSRHVWLSAAIAFAVGVGIVLHLLLGPSMAPESVPLSSRPRRPASSVPSLTKRFPKLAPSDLRPESSADIDGQAPADSNPISPADQSHHVSDKARALLASPLDGTTFRKALDILKDPDETLESRLLALQWLSAAARKLGPDERRLLHEVTSALAADAAEAAPLRARAMRSAVAISALMRDMDEMRQVDISTEDDFMVRMAADRLLDPSIRAAAIKGIEVLRITEGIALLEQTLADPEEQATADVARRACLALTRLSPEKALPLVSRVIRETEDASVFGTAAYSLGQIKSPRAVAALVQNAERFPDTGSCDFALVDMEETILATLKEPTPEDIIPAIRATRYLWRDGQSEKFIPLLEELVDNPASETRKAAVERLLEEAAARPLADEKELLKDVLERAKEHEDLTELCASMEKRLTARVLKPETSTMPIALPKPKEE